jgi:PAS domain S-box-containing protein
MSDPRDGRSRSDGGRAETEGESVFRRAFERLPDPALLWRRREDGRIVLERVNAAARRTSRGAIADLVGLEVTDFFSHAPEVAVHVRRAFETAEVLRLEFPYHLRTTGEEQWVLADYVRISPTYVLNTIRDITPRKRVEEALRRAKEEQTIVLDAMMEMLAYHNTDLEIQWANRASGLSVGQRAEELVGRHCYEVWHQRDAPCEDCPVLRALATGTLQEAEVVTPDGRVWFLRGVPVLEGQEIVGVVEFGQDVTHRTRVEERLRLFEAIIEASHEAIAISDAEGRLVYVNPAHERLFGRSLEEARRLNYRDYYPPEAVEILESETVPALMRGEGWEGELDVLDADGRRFPLWERADSIRDAEGRMRYGFGLMHDVTERRRAEEAYHAVVNHSLQGLCIVQDRRVVFTNSALAEMFGYTRDAVLALRPEQIEEMFTPEGRAFVDRQRSDHQAGRLRDTRYEIQIVDKGGNWRWTEQFVTPIEYQGRPALQIAVIDVTERKEAERRLADSNAELEQYAYVISHDLREPLRVMASYLRLLEQRYGETLDGEAREYVAYAADAVQRMKGMTRGLLDLSRVERRGGPLVPTDGEALLAHTLSVLSLAIEESGARVTHDPLPTVLADEVQLAQVLQNLLENAIKFRRPGQAPRIHVAAEQVGDEWVLSVSDDGVGLDVAQSERVFQVFQRLHTRDEYPGQGLGLALCKKIVTRHGGRIWVESMPDQGATFFFTLPRAQAGAGA